jgi:hypothetical protein
VRANPQQNTAFTGFPLTRTTTQWYKHTVVFIESKAFTSRLLALAGADADGVLSQIQKDLLENPERGVMPPSLCGMRKDRASNPNRGKGKRSGFRYGYLYLKTKHHIHLLFLLDKDVQEDLTAEQRKVIKALVKRLKGN